MRHVPPREPAMTITAGLVLAIATAAVCLTPGDAVAAGKYDGSTRMLCVPTIVVECAAEGPEADCHRRTPAAVDLPQFLDVDVKAMMIQAEGGGRKSPVRTVDHLNDTLIIQGGQDGRGWTLAISEQTGRMSGAVSAHSEGFVIFGACTFP